ncbi:MAG: TonB-dependent receptor [Rudaea sp.]|uniref:TonB-dependent receptor domain-containing protein n=1 Tax=Rudaea sp. TaxID=2136325 RepID=UPI0039E60143
MAALLLSVAAGAQAQGPSGRVDFSIPPQSLASALIEFSRQANVQVLTSGANLESAKSPGVNGKLAPAAALNKLLEGTAFTPEFTDAGTVVVKPGAAKPAAARAAEPPTRNDPAPTAQEPPKELEKVTVTGSRIPRAQIEGPAPITVVSARDIAQRGFTTVADIMTSLSQNLGDLDNNQITDGFSNGAQAVDLRGLGPNHTLILINGRRIADYPQSYGGSSNFTDITNIPASMIDRVEVLTGSASAVYGSDAISGVINFIMKKKADGTTLDYRMGDTQHGGAASQRFTLTSGWSNDKFDSMFGVEIYNQDPLWAYQRSYLSSRTYDPRYATSPTRVAAPTFVIMDEDEDYIDPGQATCDKLSYLNQGTVQYLYRRSYGYYCGSLADVGYGTMQNARRAANFYGSATYHFNEHMDFFADVQYSTSHQETYNTQLKWENCYPVDGDSSPTPFYNTATGEVEQWQRQYFTYEENGGLKRAMIRNIDNTLSLNTGIKGTFGDSWNYEALFSHAQNDLEAKWPALVAAKAQAYYLGPSLGIDPDSGYEMYYAPYDRLYTPLTPAQFASITQDSIDHDKSRAENYSISVNNTELFSLPAGPVGFAAVAEYGNQYFGLKPDPLSLDGSYFGLHNTVAVGSRSHSGAGFEFSVPVFSQLTLTAAGRYDRYEYSSNTASKFTYALGVEYRPIDSLLLRGSYSTGFRAPDLAYLYAGPSGSSSGGTDYYRCAKEESDLDLDDCDWGDVSFDGRSNGSIHLKNETSKSLSYGFVFSPLRGLDINADYYIIKLSNEVTYQDSDQILRWEAQCRLGQLDINSGLCQAAINQVFRNSAGDITSVLVLPINAATHRTSGVDFNIRYLWETDRFGSFDFKLGGTYVVTNRIQNYPGDPFVNELSDYYDYVIPRSKANYSVTWNYGDFTTTLYGARLGGIPNYDGDQRMGPTMLYNASFGYLWAKNVNIGVTIDNLFDSKPGRDNTWTSYPYYARRWFSPLGRALFVDLSVKFGGSGG